MNKFVVRVLNVRGLIALLAAVTVTMFTLAAVHNNDTFYGDAAVFGALRFENESWQRFFAHFDITIPLSVGSVLLLSAAMVMFGKWWEALATLFILPAQALTITLPKLFVARPRPEGALEGLTNSFPSGTAATSILVLGFLIYLVGVFVATRWVRITQQLLLGLMIIILGVFRMFASEHWPSDLVGGYLAGGLALIAIIWLYRRLRGAVASTGTHELG